METAELYTLAAKFHAQALTIMTVSDSLVTGEAVPPAERETTFRDMMRLACGDYLKGKGRRSFDCVRIGL
jgi:purine-nucleoside phosphorylase